MPIAGALAIVALCGYLLGSIPFGVLIGRLGGTDPRQMGSGRIGTTNVLRSFGRAGAAVVLVLDVGKGLLAVTIGLLLADRLAGGALLPAVAGVAAVVGHVRSVFIGFGGGRGVATGGGAMLGLAPVAVLVAIPVFGLLVWRTRYVSLGSLAAVVTVAAVTLVLAVSGAAPLPTLFAALVIGAIVIVAHGDNIERLAAGTERRLGERATEAAPHG